MKANGGLVLRLVEKLRGSWRVLWTDPHSPAAPAGSRLDHHRKADVIGPAAGFFDRLQRFVGSRQDGQSCFLHCPTRLDLIAHQPNLVRFRPDESNARHFADFRETGVLRRGSRSRGEMASTSVISAALIIRETFR